MTAYVHIGNWKTGTTTIQNFMTINYNRFVELGFLYPMTINSRINHYLLVVFSKNPDLAKKYWLELKNEIKNSNCNNVIFSAENLIDLSQDITYVYNLKEFLISLGFHKIYIILYIRETSNFLNSLCSQEVRADSHLSIAKNTPAEYFQMKFLFDYKMVINCYSRVFSKENLTIKLFDKNEFYQGDLLKDFLNIFNIKMDGSFVKPNKEIKNKSLNLLGIELLSRVKKYLDFPWLKIQKICNKYFTFDDPDLKFQPKKEIMQSYLDYFEESNEWVRKEFFSHKERLFPKKDLSNYKENYELKEMKPEYWDKIAEFIADIIEIKNQNIIDKANIIQNKDKVIIEQTTQIKSLHTTIKQKDDIINFNINHINQLQNNIQEKSTQLNQIQSKLFFQAKYGTAKSRIQNQLSYKLGQAMIVNSKSFLGYIRMPFVLSYIKDKHKQEQKIYQEKIKKDPLLALPPLEDYPDYKEALKEKECLTYKLGQALIKANKTWYGGGVYQVAV
ncbi:hypothetical protein L8W58_00765 [Campylobacter lari]|nr:hypothetical protein [Campylobacter lari]